MRNIYSVSSGRKGEIDFVKGISILSVVIGHLVVFDGPVFQWIFGFHMPAFFLLYGFMLKETPMPFPRFVIKQIKRLMVPTWVYRLVYFMVVITAIEQTAFSWGSMLFDVFWNATLEWFLPVMFWVTIGMYVYVQLYHKIGNQKLTVLLSILFITVITTCGSVYRIGYHDTTSLPFKLNSAALALSFAIIGFWIRKYDLVSVCATEYRAISTKWIRAGVLIGLLGIYTFLVMYNSWDNYVNMADYVLGNSVLIYYVAGTMMFLMLIVAGKQMNDSASLILRWIRLLGRNSLLIYLGHDLINKFVTELIKIYTDGQLVLIPMINLNVTWIVVFFAVAMTVLTAICLLKEKIRGS